MKEVDEYGLNLALLFVGEVEAGSSLGKDIVEVVTEPMLLPFEPKFSTDLRLREVVACNSLQVIFSRREQVLSVRGTPVEIRQKLKTTAVAPNSPILPRDCLLHNGMNQNNGDTCAK